MTDDFALTPLSPKDLRFTEFKELIERGHLWACHELWRDKIDAPFPIGWSAPDGKQLKEYLKRNPSQTSRQFAQTLIRYFRSESHTPGEAAFRFLPHLDKYRVEVLDRFARSFDAKTESHADRTDRAIDAAFARARQNRLGPQNNGNQTRQGIERIGNQPVARGPRLISHSGD
jgi:hypothetical protein